MEIIGHRGASGGYPENTMPAFQRAWELGVDGVEFDVQRTRDGRYVVFHDDDGRRLAGRTSIISETDWSDCSPWDVGKWKGDAFRNTPIPLLDDILKAAPLSKRLLLEIKFGDPVGLIGLAEQLQAYPHLDICLLTFDEVLAGACRRAIKDRPVILNVEALTSGLLDKLPGSGFHGISMKWSPQIDEGIMGRIKNSGLKSAVWTVNDPEDAVRAKAMGVDWLMTDWPERMIERLRHER